MDKRDDGLRPPQPGGIVAINEFSSTSLTSDTAVEVDLKKSHPDDKHSIGHYMRRLGVSNL